jgi:hypothetical protein
VDNDGTTAPAGGTTLPDTTRPLAESDFYSLKINHLRRAPGHGFSTACYFRSKKNCA